MKKDNKSEDAILRQKAEEILKMKPSKSVLNLSEGEMTKLIHDFEVHQIELELQIQELSQAKENSELLENNQANEQLRDNKLGIELAMQAANLSWWKMDTVSGTVTFGKSKAEMLGFPPERFKHYTDFMALVHPEDHERTMNAMLRHLDGTIDKYEVEYRILTQSGGYKWFYDVGSVVKRDINGKPLIVTGLVIDISKRKMDEEALKKSKDLLAESERIAGWGSWEFDVISGNTHISEGIKWISGLPADYPLIVPYQTSTFDLVHPDDAAIFNSNMERTIREGVPWNCEYRIIRKDNGQVRYRRSLGGVKRDETGRVISVIGADVDVTEFKQAEKDVLESEKRFRAIFDQAPVAIALLEMNGRIIISNLTLSKMVGYTNEELSEMKFADFTYQEDVDKDLNQFIALIEGIIPSYSMEKRYVHKNGNLVWANFYVTILRDENGITSEIIGMAEDITERKRTEDALINSEIRYRRLFESAKDGILILDADNGMITDVNPFLIEKLGYFEDQFLDKAIWEIGFFKDIVASQDKFLELQQKEYVRYDDLPLETADGQKINVEFVSNVYLVNKKKVIQCNIRDITKRKQAELALRHSETHLRTLVHTIPDLIWLKDTNGMYLSCNTMFERFFGTKEANIIGKTDYDFIDQELADLFRENDRKAIEAGKPTSNEEWITFADDGHHAYLETIKTPMNDSNGILLGVLGIGRDITARKQAEESLKKQKDDFETIFNLVPVQIWYKDTHNNFIRVNRQVCTDIGMTNDKIEGHSAEELFPSFAQQYFNDDLKVFNTRMSKLGIIEQFNTSKDEIRWVYTDKIPVFGNDGEINGLIAVVQDITERKRSEKALQESEERFRHSFDYAATGICLVAINGKFQRINKAFKEMTGYDDDELKNFTFNDITHPDDILIGLSQLEKLLNGEIDHASFEKRYIRKDKRIFWTYVSTSLIRDINHQPQFFITQIIDISERKQSEKEIVMLAHSLKSINECVSITDLDNKILFVNESFLKTYGYEIIELIGEDISIVRSQDEDNKQVNEILHTTIRGEWQGECLNKRKDGSEFTIYLSTTVIKDKENKILGLIGVATDITERKLAEKELIEAKNKAEESDRLKSAFLANMSHEVRTPLNSIIGFSELLADPDFEEEQKYEFIQSIITSGNNLLIIISDIMDISKMESGEIKIRKSQINVQRFISTVKEQFSIQAEVKKLELKVTHTNDGEETFIFADVERLRQIFNNLMSNAIKFTANGSIEIGYQPKDKMVEFYVKDTGIGIPADYQNKIFDRFRQVEDSSTRRYGGNGLGLAISKNLVELMGGEIWIESELDKGSVFYFTLPTYTRGLY